MEGASNPTDSRETNTTTSSSSLKSSTPRGRRTSLSAWNTSLLIASIFSTFAAIAFLAYLWTASRDSISAPRRLRPESLLYKIAHARWIERSITVTTVVIRICTVWQASLCVPILANFLLLKSKVRLSTLPAFSIIRAANASPLDLLFLLHRTRWWQVTKNMLLWFLAALLLITTLSIQFASTMLLSDIRPLRLSALDEKVHVPKVKDFDLMAIAHEDANTPSLTVDNIPRFATDNLLGTRYTDRDGPDGMMGHYENYEDTGVSARALLPFSNRTTRENMHLYNGTAPIYEQQTFCIAPEIAGELMLEMGFAASIRGKLRIPRLSATVISADTLPDGMDEWIEFPDCPFAQSEPIEWAPSLDAIPRLKTESKLSVCPFNNLRGYQNVPTMHYNSTSSPLLYSYLIINRTANGGEDWMKIPKFDRGRPNYDPSEDPNPESDGEVFNTTWASTEKRNPWHRSTRRSWTVLKHKKAPEVEIGVSICINGNRQIESNIKITAFGPLSSDPAIKWDPMSRDWDTTNVLGMHINRMAFPTGIFFEAEHDQGFYETWAQSSQGLPGEYGYYISDNDHIVSPTVRKNGMAVILLCLWCRFSETRRSHQIEFFHKAAIILFQDALAKEGNLAVAFATLTMLMTQAWYYDMISGEFKNQDTDESILRQYETYHLPGAWWGFGAVMGILGLHLLLVAIVAGIWFWISTNGITSRGGGFKLLNKRSKTPESHAADVSSDEDDGERKGVLGDMIVMGDSWRAVRQATHGDVVHVYDGFGEIEDGKVQKILRKRGGDVNVSLAWSSGGGSVVARP